MDVDLIPCHLEALVTKLESGEHTNAFAESYWWDHLFDGDVFEEDEDAEAHFLSYGDQLVKAYRTGAGKIRPELVWRLGSMAFSLEGPEAHSRIWPSEDSELLQRLDSVVADRPIKRLLDDRPLFGFRPLVRPRRDVVTRPPALGWLAAEEIEIVHRALVGGDSLNLNQLRTTLDLCMNRKLDLVALSDGRIG